MFRQMHATDIPQGLLRNMAYLAERKHAFATIRAHTLCATPPFPASRAFMASPMCIKHVLEQIPGELGVPREQKSAIDAGLGGLIPQPILVGHEEVLAGLCQLGGHHPHDVVVRLHQRRISVENEHVGEVLWAFKVVHHHLVLLPIVVLSTLR